MTKLRALHGALAGAATALAIGATAHAGVANYTIDAGSSQSEVDNACVGALPGVLGEDCTYNQSNPANVPTWVGPVRGSNYYRGANSPFQKDPNAVPLPQPPFPDPDSAALNITGTLVIDDVNGTECDGDDTVAGRFELEAGTRTFSGGPGTFGEETWGPNTIVYVLPASVPDSQTGIAEGCEYIFGNKGFPPLLQTLNGQTYPVDADVVASGAAPPASETWDSASNPTGIGVGTFEGPGFDGNTGVTVSVDTALRDAGTYICVENTGGPASPAISGACNFAPGAAGTPCDSDGSHFCGAREVMENWIMRIVVDPSGDILVPALAFANNESIVFNVPPAPNANNSWDGPLLTFTATCDDCSIAKDDSFTFVTGTNPPTVALPIGANDDPNAELDNTNTTLAITAPPTHGACLLTGANPGDATLIGCDYTPTDNFAGAGTDSFIYTLDDAILDPMVVDLEATVTVTVQTDAPPAANPFTITLDSRGVDPTTLSDTVDALTGVAGNDGGNNPTVSADATAQKGTATVSGSEISYAANGSFFQGTDTFNYTIDDDNFGSPGVQPESDTDQVTVNIANVLPTASDVTGTVESGNSVGFAAGITLGNGTIAQHTAAVVCDSGTAVINGIGLNGAAVEVDGTYTAPADFSGNAVCTYTVTDEAGAGDPVNGTVTITVTESSVIIRFPGSGSALDPWSLALLLIVPLLRSPVYRRPRRRRGVAKSGVVS